MQMAIDLEEVGGKTKNEYFARVKAEMGVKNEMKHLLQKKQHELDHMFDVYAEHMGEDLDNFIGFMQ